MNIDKLWMQKVFNKQGILTKWRKLSTIYFLALTSLEQLLF